MRNQVLWRKIARITMILSDRLDISPERALEIFIQSETFSRLHQPKYGLHLMSDDYIVEDVIMELHN